jgi:hypothetical protein
VQIQDQSRQAPYYQHLKQNFPKQNLLKVQFVNLTRIPPEKDVRTAETLKLLRQVSLYLRGRVMPEAGRFRAVSELRHGSLYLL